MKIKNFVRVYKPELLTSLGLSSLIGSSLLNILGTTKAVKIVEQEKNKTGKLVLTKKEVIKLTWKCYIPGAVCLGIGIPCIFAGNAVNLKENAAMAAAYAATQTTLNNFKQETIKAIGSEKTKEIEQNANQATIEQNPPQQLVVLNEDDYVIMDEISGRYFKSNWNKVYAAANELNARAISGNDIITLGEWYTSLGMKDIDCIGKLGWSVYNCGTKGLIDVYMSTCMLDGKPIGLLKYNNYPRSL